jgi:serine/threonine protein kinase
MSSQGEGSGKQPTSSASVSKRDGFLKPGQLLGNGYEVVEQIGEGGMAIVYKALQKSLDRYVAIKAMHPKFSRDAEFIARFKGESGALAALSHPNIVSIIDRGNEGDVYYFVMEYVDGDNLDLKIIGNKLTPNDWRQVVSSCSAALDYVHKRGVVHRDIKPSNILIDSEGRVKIGDFGIAHIMGGDMGYQGPAKALGTAHYMAPEQTSDPASVDHRADIYALGVAFYKMLTRQLPIGDYPAPSEANREVPIAVDAVIFQAMAPNREDRYQTVQAFCDDMQKALREQTTNITSLLNYRGASTGSALYTGTDFRTPVPAAGSSAENKKLGTDPATRSKTATGSATGTGTGSGVRRTPLPIPGGRVSASKDLTPMPLPGGSAKPAAPPTKTPLYLGVGIALLAGIGVAVYLAMASDSGSRNPLPVPEPAAPAVSEARLREQRERAERERQQQELLQRRNRDSNASQPGQTTDATQSIGAPVQVDSQPAPEVNPTE